MTEGLGLSIEYVNWINSELHAIRYRVDNDGELANVVYKLVCQSRDQSRCSLGDIFDRRPSP